MSNDELDTSGFLQQLANQLHPPSLFRARAQLRNTALHSAGPVPACRCSWNVEPIFSREQVGDHHNRDPRFALKKRVHRRGVKVTVEIDLLATALKFCERRDLLQIRTRLNSARIISG